MRENIYYFALLFTGRLPNVCDLLQEFSVYIFVLQRFSEVSEVTSKYFGFGFSYGLSWLTRLTGKLLVCCYTLLKTALL